VDPSERLEDRIHELKAGLVAVTRGEQTELNEARFRETRRLLIGSPTLGTRVPIWLKRASTLVEANTLIRTEADQRPGGKWANRAALIAEGLNPLLDDLDQERSAFESTGELHERLGSGGFGEVFRWRHKLLDVDFAVKILNPAFPAEDGRYLERFFREARILLQLNHPNIVRVYDVGMVGKRPFIRMELLAGDNLNSLFMRGALSPSDAAQLAFALAEGLSHAHAKGIVHRDIKPSNVFLTAEGRVCLIDFGLGAFVEGDLISRLTRMGEAAAGGLFTAPELVSDPHKLDVRTDIYSLGAVWFNALTGRPPAGAAIEAQLRAVDGLPKEHIGVLLRTLSDEASRFPSASELAAAITGLDA
jgi:eukaryotic-like serine/threonine-protein kinase